jgi:hypothetical protein
MLDHSCQTQRHPYSERGLDLYGTPPQAVPPLLRVEQLPPVVWEPAAGRGNIVKELRAAGHQLIASDIVSYDFPLDFVQNFFSCTAMPAGCQGIVSNGPYRWIEQFVAHALELSPIVVVLLRLTFLESERRCAILENRGLARIHVFRKRLPMMHRNGWEGRKANSGMAFCWMRWDRDYTGPTVIDRISWER